MKRTALYSVMALVLVLGMALSMAAPVMASEISATKDRDPDESPYHVGQTIHFVMTVLNPDNNTEINTLTRVWDTLPDGTVIEFLYAGSPYGETLVQAPSDVDYFYAEYVVAEADIEWIVPPDPLIDPYWGVLNTFEAQGYDTGADDLYAYVEKHSRVIRDVPPVGGEAFPISRLAILAPWIVLGAAIIASAVIFPRRRQAQG